MFQTKIFKAMLLATIMTILSGTTSSKVGRLSGSPLVKAAKSPLMSNVLKKAGNAIKGGVKKDLVRKIFKNGLDSQEVWNGVQESIRFMKNVRKYLDKNEEIDLADFKRFEILSCNPDGKGKTCHSECSRRNAHYQYCHTDSKLEDWDYCRCSIRPDIRKFLILAKKKLLESPSFKNQSINHDIIQYVGLSFLVLLVLAILACLMGRLIYLRRQQNQQPPEQG